METKHDPPPTTNNLLAQILDAALTSGRCIIVAARSSREGGKKGYEAAVDDFRQALTVLAKDFHDFCPLVPSAQELMARLKGAPAVISLDSNGRKFTNRFLTLDLRNHGLYGIISVGSGRKLTEDFNQPFVRFVAERVREVTPVMPYAKRIDRLGRNPLVMAEMLVPIQERHDLIGDTRHRIRQLDSLEKLRFFFEASESPVSVRGGWPGAGWQDGAGLDESPRRLGQHHRSSVDAVQAGLNEQPGAFAIRHKQRTSPRVHPTLNRVSLRPSRV